MAVSILIGIAAVVCHASFNGSQLIGNGSQLIGILSASDPHILRAFRIAELLDGRTDAAARLCEYILHETETAYLSQRDALLNDSPGARDIASGISRFQSSIAHAILAFAIVELGKADHFRHNAASISIFREISRELEIPFYEFFQLIVRALKFVRIFGFAAGVNNSLVFFLQSPSDVHLERIRECIESAAAARLIAQQPATFITRSLSKRKRDERGDSGST